MFRKFSIVSFMTLVLGISCLSSPSKSSPPTAQSDELLIQRTGLIAPPVSILNAKRDPEGLSVEAQNNSTFVVEYFEFQVGRGSRVMLGRNSLSEKFTKHPEYAKTPELRFGPGEIRVFRFSAPQSAENTISVKVVLLLNGQGWLNGVWLKKLDKADERGLLWGVDKEENKRLLNITFRTNRSRFTSNSLVFTKSANLLVSCGSNR